MSGRKINLIDTTLRDGSHAVSHSFTVEQVKAIAGGLDRAGVDFIKLSHGDGIGGSSINYGFSAADDSLSNPAGRVFWNGTQLFVLEKDDGTNKLSG